MSQILSAIPSEVWTLIFLIGMIAVTMGLWYWELRGFIAAIGKLTAPGENDGIIKQCKYVVMMISKLPLAFPFVIDFAITTFLVGTFSLGGNVGTGLAFFMSDCISVAIIVVIISQRKT